MKNACRIYLLRHGDVINPMRTFYSQLDVPLSPKGKEQSIQVSRRLAEAGIGSIISSDLSRCRFMAEKLSEFSGVGPVFTAALREVNFGKWSGLTWEQIEEAYPGAFENRMNDLTNFRPPGGENLKDVRERALPVLMEACNSTCSSVALIAHGGVNRILLASILEMPLENIFSIDQGHACVNIVDIYPDGINVVKAINLPFSQAI